MMEALLQLLQNDARLSVSDLATRLGWKEAEVEAALEKMTSDGTILGYHAVVDHEMTANGNVFALIEVKLSPERGGGFDRLAQRVARFDQVTSCFLMSGGYDLAVFVEAEDLRDVASFVSEKLSTLEGVLSTTTHFQLKVYKQNGFLASGPVEESRLPVTP